MADRVERVIRIGDTGQFHPLVHPLVTDEREKNNIPGLEYVEIYSFYYEKLKGGGGSGVFMPTIEFSELSRRAAEVFDSLNDKPTVAHISGLGPNLLAAARANMDRLSMGKPFIPLLVDVGPKDLDPLQREQSMQKLSTSAATGNPLKPSNTFLAEAVATYLKAHHAKDLGSGGIELLNRISTPTIAGLTYLAGVIMPFVGAVVFRNSDTLFPFHNLFPTHPDSDARHYLVPGFDIDPAFFSEEAAPSFGDIISLVRTHAPKTTPLVPDSQLKEKTLVVYAGRLSDFNKNEFVAAQRQAEATSKGKLLTLIIGEASNDDINAFNMIRTRIRGRGCGTYYLGESLPTELRAQLFKTAQRVILITDDSTRHRLALEAMATGAKVAAFGNGFTKFIDKNVGDVEHFPTEAFLRDKILLSTVAEGPTFRRIGSLSHITSRAGSFSLAGRQSAMKEIYADAIANTWPEISRNQAELKRRRTTIDAAVTGVRTMFLSPWHVKNAVVEAASNRKGPISELVSRALTDARTFESGEDVFKAMRRIERTAAKAWK